MGTNYYAEIKPPCPTCGHGGEKIHIGKSSQGWPFTFRGYDEEHSYSDRTEVKAVLRDWATWKTWLLSTGGRILDEYGEVLSLDALEELVVTKRRYSTQSYIRSDDFARMTDDGDLVSLREFQ